MPFIFQARLRFVGFGWNRRVSRQICSKSQGSCTNGDNFVTFAEYANKTVSYKAVRAKPTDLSVNQLFGQPTESNDMQYLQLHFRNRPDSFLIPVSGADLHSFTEQLGHQDEQVGTVRVRSLYGHFVIINTERLQYARHLLEMTQPEFDPSTILPSPIDQDDLTGESDDDHQVDLIFWFSQRSDYLILDSVPGGNATKLHLADNSGHLFVTLTDEDDEDVTVHLPECDLIVEVEHGRYPSEILACARGMPLEWKKARARYEPLN